MNEREWDRRLHIRTIGREDESSADYSPYEPTPYAVLERISDSGVIRRRHRVLDYGCGKGRAVIFLASVVGCRATGVDYSKKLIDLARENARTSGKGDRTRFICSLAEQYVPADEDVFFFFNPFSARVFGAVLRRLEASWLARPREMRVCCYFPSDEYLACLAAVPALKPLAEIDCRDLFGGKNPRERVVVYAFAAGEGK